MNRSFRCGIVALSVSFLAACGGGGDSGGGTTPPPPPPTGDVTVTLATAPAGLLLTVNGDESTGSYTAAPGTARNLGATTQKLNGRLYEFGSWSQGGPAVQTVTTPSANTTYTATFIDRGPTTNNAPIASLLSAPTSARVNVATALNASATDVDTGDSIVRVQFLSSGLVIGESTTAPFTMNWTPTTAGEFRISARAYDSFGLSKDSPTLKVTVTN